MPPQPQPPLPPPSPIQEQYERQERSVITTSSKHEESSQMQRNEYLGHQQHTVDQEQQVQRQQEQEQRQIQQKKTDLRALSASPTMYDFSKSRVRPPTPRPFVPFCAAAATTTATTSSVALGHFHGARTEVRETSAYVAEMTKADATGATTMTATVESRMPRNTSTDFAKTSNTATTTATEEPARPATPVMAKTSAKPPMSPKPRRKRDHPQRPSSATGT